MFVHLVEGILSHELFGAAQVVRGRDGIEAEVVGQEIAGVFPGEGFDPDESQGGPGRASHHAAPRPRSHCNLPIGVFGVTMTALK